MKNWFGIESHPTDNLIHWKTDEKSRLKQAEELRKAYDTIRDAGLEPELLILLCAARQAGVMDEVDANAGEEI